MMHFGSRAVPGQCKHCAYSTENTSRHLRPVHCSPACQPATRAVLLRCALDSVRSALPRNAQETRHWRLRTPTLCSGGCALGPVVPINKVSRAQRRTMPQLATVAVLSTMSVIRTEPFCQKRERTRSYGKAETCSLTSYAFGGNEHANRNPGTDV